MTDQTFHVTREELRKLESEESRKYGGKIPPESDVSILKVYEISPLLSCNTVSLT
jgi:hypothetical protein